MISAVGGNSSIQMLNALNAFKANREVTKPSELNELNTPDGINLSDNNKLLNKIDVSDVRNFAQKLGESVSDEDIKYGLTYGRSVIANYLA